VVNRGKEEIKRGIDFFFWIEETVIKLLRSYHAEIEGGQDRRKPAVPRTNSKPRHCEQNMDSKTILVYRKIELERDIYRKRERERERGGKIKEKEKYGARERDREEKNRGRNRKREEYRER
jgi:hypothetical protein